MQRYFIRMAYHGGNYHGWQVQKNAHTVQAEMEEKLAVMLGGHVSVTGCGRTDTGVHAREFYAHFDMEKPLKDARELAFRLNVFLPDDIVVFDIFPVAPDMHARFSAVSRTYRYYISRQKDPFYRDLQYEYTGRLNIEAMKEASRFILGKQDFTSFSKLHTQTTTNICTVTEALWTEDDNRLIFTISADRFLRNMVRAVVGTLFEVGKGKIQPEDVKNIIDAKDRSHAGFSVPARGLFLEKVEYEFGN
ncbi:MAG: tRNA pseudouridine(38-40) synthase TruA [Chlorobi bacterium]|nr:tRNA pseudouridine(38-40) synthase TruA [Chlorobiota bacterium]